MRGGAPRRAVLVVEGAAADRVAIVIDGGDGALHFKERASGACGFLTIFSWS
jgi:hypothetical protein